MKNKFAECVENAAVERTEVSLCLGMKIVHVITCYSVLVDHNLALSGKTYVSLQEKHSRSFTFFPVIKVSKLFSVMKMVIFIFLPLWLNILGLLVALTQWCTFV